MTDLKSFLNAESAVARVELTEVKGSSPREAGTAMFVSPDATHGTIGGGQLEYMAIDQARTMLAAGRDKDRMSVPLGPEIGQCCGGHVEIDITLMDRAAIDVAVRECELAQQARPHVYVFGAGHIGRALADCLALLPVRTILVDERAEEIALCTAPVQKRITPLPEAEVRRAPAGSAFIILTHEHALDFLIAAEALARTDSRYVGMIGSKTKRASFERWCRKNINPPIRAENLVCPIGAQGSSDKRPEVIAAFVAAEVIATLTVDSDRRTGHAPPSENVGGVKVDE
ncbi:MAG: xanthine dehydrogenase accessory protein XdhC [Alphaproteobacteria bacterium]|nr:xanthine dehydrogenase accessory protein XdhC [Alphaproteobacteria bacterium]